MTFANDCLLGLKLHTILHPPSSRRVMVITRVSAMTSLTSRLSGRLCETSLTGTSCSTLATRSRYLTMPSVTWVWEKSPLWITQWSSLSLSVILATAGEMNVLPVDKHGMVKGHQPRCS